MKNTIIIILVLIIIGGGAYYFLTMDREVSVEMDEEQDTDINGEEQEEIGVKPIETIGTSASGNDITAYHYVSSATSTEEADTELLFVGGIHGGYAWNTILVAYELMDYLEENQDTIPQNVMVTVIPVLNPDGLNTTLGTTDRFTKADVPSSKEETVPGRFNGNEVDLNRNFDCDWQSDATWQSRDVSGGSEAFSEPESQAIKNYVETNNPDAVVVFYSAAGGVFSSNCHNGVPDKTLEITNLYADASGYKAYEDFNFYEITGDMVNWLAKENVPAISVLLTTHEVIEWDKNKAGIEALLGHFTE